jgi:hypothetical protein
MGVSPMRKRLKRTLTYRDSSSDSEGAPSQDLVPLQGSLVNVEAIPQFTVGANQRYANVINLMALPSALAVRVVEKAPFLLGYQNAEYGIEFFSRVAGLCSSGPHPRTGITKEMMLKNEMHPCWRPALRQSRITLSQVDNKELRDRYKALYCRVYGGKPDNGSIA